MIHILNNIKATFVESATFKSIVTGRLETMKWKKSEEDLCLTTDLKKAPAHEPISAHCDQQSRMLLQKKRQQNTLLLYVVAIVEL